MKDVMENVASILALGILVYVGYRYGYSDARGKDYIQGYKDGFDEARLDEGTSYRIGYDRGIKDGLKMRKKFS